MTTEEVNKLIDELRGFVEWWGENPPKTDMIYGFIRSDDKREISASGLGRAADALEALLRDVTEREADFQAAKAREELHATWEAIFAALIADVYTILKPVATTGSHGADSPILAAYLLLDEQDYSDSLNRVRAEALRGAAARMRFPSSGAPYEVWASGAGDWLRAEADRIEARNQPNGSGA